MTDDPTPGFDQALRLYEAADVEGLLRLAIDPSTHLDVREESLDLFIGFVGTPAEARAAEAVSRLREVATLRDQAEQVHHSFERLRGRADDLDYLLELLRNKELGTLARMDVLTVARRHLEGPRGEEVRAAEVAMEHEEEIVVHHREDPTHH